MFIKLQRLQVSSCAQHIICIYCILCSPASGNVSCSLFLHFPRREGVVST